jgi:hypothetical protein
MRCLAIICTLHMLILAMLVSTAAGQDCCVGVECHCCSCAGGPPCASPIIVDTTGQGFQLTSAENGVIFDISGTGNPVPIAWTDPKSGNAFLVLDRNHNGKIDSGKELFGDFTEQPPCPGGGHGCLNGYRALAEFDKPENGGNGDGIIDHRDAVFSKLRLWIDENHDGISQPNEVHTLPDLGVYSVSLQYRDDAHFFDEYGNWFHYQSALNPDAQDGKSKDGRLTYDVFFRIATDTPTVSPLPTLSAPIPKPLFGWGPAAELRADTAPSSNATNSAPSKSGRYRYSLVIKDGHAPRVQVWNDSDREITALAITVDLSNNVHQVEGRTYYDSYVNFGSDLPIFPHESRLIPIGYVVGSDVTKLTPKVRAVVFGDGTAVGEKIWTSALMARRKHLYASLLNLRGLLAEQAAGTVLREVVGKVKGVKNDMRRNVPKNEFRIVDDLVFDSAIRMLSAARGDSTHVLKSYARQLEVEIGGVARSHLQGTSEPEVVPPHLDGRNLASENVKSPRRAGTRDARLTRASFNEKLGLKRMFADTFSCAVTNMTDIDVDACTDPPTNTNPAPAYTLQATLTATDSTTGAKSTTVFSTTSTASGMCTYYTTGMCTYYTNCDGELANDDYEVVATADEDALDGGTEFFWVMSHYTVEPTTGCDCDDPDPNGVVWNYTTSSNHGTLFWVAGSGNASNQCSSEVKIE